MKSIVSNEVCEKKELPYPKLMIGIYSGNIILCTNSTKAVYLYYRDGNGVLGTDVTDKYSNFKDFNGSVCLQNDEVAR